MKRTLPDGSVLEGTPEEFHTLAELEIAAFGDEETHSPDCLISRNPLPCTCGGYDA